MNSDDIFRLYPRVLKTDKALYALGRVISDYLAKNCELMDREIIYAAMDKLSEAVLDILAYDLKVDWYEYSAPIENKRRAIKEAMFVHRYKGTKYAVETALHSVFTDAKVEEWFEYGSEPFHFKLTVYGGTNNGGLKNLYLKIQYAKNLRSVMDDVIFVIIPEMSIEVFCGAICTALSKERRVNFKTADDGTFTVSDNYFAVGELTGKSKYFRSDFQYTAGESPPKKLGESSVGACAGAFAKTIRMEMIL